MRRSACAVIFLLMIAVSHGAMAQPPAALMLDPADGYSVSLPSEGWIAAPGIGAMLLVVHSPSGGRIEVRRRECIDVVDDDGARMIRGGRVRSRKMERRGSLQIEEVLFSRSSEGRVRRGVALIAADERGGVEVSFVDDAARFLEGYLICRDLIEAFAARPGCTEFVTEAGEISLPSLEAIDARGMSQLSRAAAQAPASLSAAVRLTIGRALYALLDGRAGCPGVAEEVRRVSSCLAARDLRDWSTRLRRVAHVLEKAASERAHRHSPDAALDAIGEALGSALPRRGAYRRFVDALRLGREGRRLEAQSAFPNGVPFVDLQRALLLLGDGEGDRARRSLARFDAGSDASGPHSCLAEGVRRRLRRLVPGSIGDGDDVLAAACDCGAAGAFIAYEQGMALLRDDPEKAVERLRRAIALDPGVVPAYLGLARALLDRGDGSRMVLAEMQRLLEDAPDLPAIRRLRGELDRIVSGARRRVAISR